MHIFELSRIVLLHHPIINLLEITNLQWYNIVHFEHKLSWLYFWFLKRPRINGDLFLTYKPMIIPLISQRGTPSQQSSTILPSNKVHHRASLKAYRVLKQTPFNRGSTPSLETSNKIHNLFSTLESLLTIPPTLTIFLFDI